MKLDHEEKDILNSFERGEWRSVRRSITATVVGEIRASPVCVKRFPYAFVEW